MTPTTLHTTNVYTQGTQHHIAVRVLWFLFVGSWLGFAAVLLAYLLILTILGIPLGFVILDNVSTVFTLKRAR